ncbi:hypothetical protein Ahia01_001236600, partial [Argonauta hians]
MPQQQQQQQQQLQHDDDDDADTCCFFDDDALCGVTDYLSGPQEMVTFALQLGLNNMAIKTLENEYMFRSGGFAAEKVPYFTLQAFVLTRGVCSDKEVYDALKSRLFDAKDGGRVDKGNDDGRVDNGSSVDNGSIMFNVGFRENFLKLGKILANRNDRHEHSSCLVTDPVSDPVSDPVYDSGLGLSTGPPNSNTSAATEEEEDPPKNRFCEWETYRPLFRVTNVHLREIADILFSDAEGKEDDTERYMQSVASELEISMYYPVIKGRYIMGAWSNHFLWRACLEILMKAREKYPVDGVKFLKKLQRVRLSENLVTDVENQTNKAKIQRLWRKIDGEIKKTPKIESIRIKKVYRKFKEIAKQKKVDKYFKADSVRPEDVMSEDDFRRKLWEPSTLGGNSEDADFGLPIIKPLNEFAHFSATR